MELLKYGKDEIFNAKRKFPKIPNKGRSWKIIKYLLSIVNKRKKMILEKQKHKKKERKFLKKMYEQPLYSTQKLENIKCYVLSPKVNFWDKASDTTTKADVELIIIFWLLLDNNKVHDNNNNTFNKLLFYQDLSKHSSTVYIYPTKF